jgi:uncharacterized membrane protein
MNMYKILGGDGKEYGPVSLEALRQWVLEGRANAQTQVRVGDSPNWQPLAAVPELAEMFRAAPPAISAAGAPGEIYEGDYELDISGCVSRGFELFKANVGPMLTATLIGFSPQILGFIVRILGLIPLIGILFSLIGMVISLAQIVIGGPLLGGLYSVVLKLGRGQRVETSDSFSGFKKNFLHLFLGQLVPGLFVGLCVIPMLVVFFVTLFSHIIRNQSGTPPEFSAFIPTLIAAVLTIPVVTWLTVNWMFTLALVADRQLDFWTAMKTSWRRVSRHWWTLFGLVLVVGLLNFAGLLACGVGILFTGPIGIAALMQAYETIFVPRAAQSGPGA